MTEEELREQLKALMDEPESRNQQRKLRAVITELEEVEQYNEDMHDLWLDRESW